MYFFSSCRELFPPAEAAMEASKDLRSWVEVSPESDFPIQNLPYGSFVHKGQPARNAHLGVAIGDFVLDLHVISEAGLFNGPLLKDSAVFSQVWNKAQLFISIIFAKIHPRQ